MWVCGCYLCVHPRARGDETGQCVGLQRTLNSRVHNIIADHFSKQMSWRNGAAAALGATRPSMRDSGRQPR